MPSEDLYGGADSPAMPEENQPDNQEPKEEKKEGSGQTFLLNKEIDPSFKVGEEMVVKIVAVHEKEYEVEYAPEPSKEEKEEHGEGGMAPEAPAGESGGGGEMGSMYG